MKLILSAGIACILGACPLLAQQPAEAPAPLTLRGGATPTGLYGYWDFQSNSGSPEFLKITAGNWSQLQAIFLNSMNETDIAASRRVGYAYSNDGGATWTANRAINDMRLGVPALQISSNGAPYIATYGDMGLGTATQLFSSSLPGGSFSHAGSLPNLTASGRTGLGVLWPAFTLTKDDSKAVIVGAYGYNTGEALAPLQTILLDLATKQPATPRWRNLADSAISIGVFQQYSVARSPNGTIGVAYYRSPLSTPDLTAGIYFTESTDNGATWAPAQPVLAGAVLNTDGFNHNGDPDTLFAGYNVDLTYNGEDPQIVTTGNIFVGVFDPTLTAFRNIIYWSRSKGLKMIARSHQVPGLGAYTIPAPRAQADMNALSYPTISVGEDGQHIVVAFAAASQERGAGNELISVVGEDGFFYHRLWAVGSRDGGATWGTPFIVQDFAGAGTDSASIEYPSASEIGRMVDGNYELSVVFQAKRHPGVFAFTLDGQLPGRKQEVHQYFQRFMVTPSMFQAASSVSAEKAVPSAPAISRLYPNPATTSVMVEYSLPAFGAVEIILINNLGQEVLSRSIEVPQFAGDHTGMLDVGNLPAGAYRCVIRQNGASVTSTLNIVR